MLTQSHLKSSPKSRDSEQLEADILDKRTEIILMPSPVWLAVPPPKKDFFFFYCYERKAMSLLFD